MRKGQGSSEEGNTRASGNVSRTSSAPRQMETRSAPVRSFNNNRGSAQRVQSPQPSRQMTVRQAPDRNFNNNRVSQTRNFQNSSNNQRVFSQRNSTDSNQRVIASRNGNNIGRVIFYRDRSIPECLPK